MRQVWVEFVKVWAEQVQERVDLQQATVLHSEPIVPSSIPEGVP